jgi:hypothetical protein
VNLTTRQIECKHKIEKMCTAIGLDPVWPTAIAMVESSLGEHQKSPTGCKGVFQMSSIAMKDLLEEMVKSDDDLIDIACGLAFLHLLLKRHGSIELATQRYCDPKDRQFYLSRVLSYMTVFGEDV